MTLAVSYIQELKQSKVGWGWIVLKMYGTRQVTRRKSKSGTVVKHQKTFVVLKTTSNVKWLFKSGAAPLYHSLVTSPGTSKLKHGRGANDVSYV